jgi:hypothetical protein
MAARAQTNGVAIMRRPVMTANGKSRIVVRGGGFGPMSTAVARR